MAIGELQPGLGAACLESFLVLGGTGALRVARGGGEGREPSSGDPEGRPEEPKGEQVKEGPQCALGALESGPSGGRQNGWGVTDGASGGTERKCPKGLFGAELVEVPWEGSLGEPSQRLGLKDGWRPRGGGAGGKGSRGAVGPGDGWGPRDTTWA